MTADSRKDFASFDSFAEWLRAQTRSVSGVPEILPPAPTASAGDVSSFKAQLQPYKTGCPLYYPFTFSAGHDGLKRDRDLADQMHALVLEIDADFGGLQLRRVFGALAQFRWRVIAHTTFSHRNARPCWRLIFALTRAVAAKRSSKTAKDSEADRLRAQVISLLGGAECFDAKDAGFGYFVPSHPDFAASEALFHVLGDRPIDVDTLLRSAVVLVSGQQVSPTYSDPEASRHATVAASRADLESFLARKLKFAATDESDARHAAVTQAILSGSALEIEHRDSALFAWFGSFASHFADQHDGAAPEPSSMEALCAPCQSAMDSWQQKPLSRPLLTETFYRWNEPHSTRENEKAAKRAEKSRSDAAKMALLPPLPLSDDLAPAQDSVKLRIPANPTKPNPIIDRILPDLARHPEIFRDAYNYLVRPVVVEDKNELPIMLERVETDWLVPALCDIADWFTPTKDGDRDVPASPTLAGQLLARRHYPEARQLCGVAVSPFFREDGTLVVAEGYDAASFTWLCLRGLELPAIPEHPTHADAVASVAKLKKLFADFVFEDPSMVSIYLSQILTPLARPNHSPVHVADAPNPGTGKSLSQKICALITFGRDPKSETWSGDEEEQAKIVVSSAVAARPYLWLNNISRDIRLGGSAIEGATADGSTGRILGISKNAPSLLHCTFVANGNNLKLSTDMGRRTLRARLLAKTANPALRPKDTFGIPDLEDHVMVRRGEYLAAALTVLRAYYTAGLPEPEGVRGLNMSFPEWEARVRNAIVWAGEADPVQFVAVKGDDGTDPVSEALAMLVETIELVQKANGRGSVRPSEIAEIADRTSSLMAEPMFADRSIPSRLADALAVLIPHPKRVVSQTIGYLLLGRRDEVVSVDGRSLRIVRNLDSHTKAHAYLVRDAKEASQTPVAS